MHRTLPLLAPRSSDEYEPQPMRPVDRWAAARAIELLAESEASVRTTTAATLRALDEAHGAGFYAVPADAVVDRDAAADAFASTAPVIDVQTHLVRPSRADTTSAAALFGFLRMVDPDRWSNAIDPRLLSAPAWASCVFGGSETAIALLTSPPGRTGDRVIENDDIAAVREIVDRYAGSGRVLTHTIVHPNLGPAELDAMVDWQHDLRPSGWKVYTLWDPPGRAGEGWFLDDAQTGVPFLERVEALGPRLVCAHKGIAGPIPSSAPAAASPRDIGPAAAMFPSIDFVVYHSGYDIDPAHQESSVDDDPARGVSRLVVSLRDAGIGPGANVWAELGSTWFLMLRRPIEAAHVIGKLLLAVGPERILWGTDSAWYGPPQALIDAFRVFTIPERMQEQFGYPALTTETKEQILGGNAARLYGVDAPPVGADVSWLGAARDELGARLP